MAWPTKTGFPLLALTKRRFGPLAAVTAATKVKPAPPPADRIAFGPAAVTKGTEEAHAWPPIRAPFVKFELEANVVAPPVSITFSMPAPEGAVGPATSTTEHEPGGLPLPFPSVLANPARLGPPRFTALDRKTLGID